MRFLITTSDERSWRYGEPVVLLGEWCRRFDRESAWSRLDAVMARPYCPTGTDRDAATARVSEVGFALLTELGAALAEQHGMRADARFWRILLGLWVHRHVSLLHHRWHAVQQLVQDHEISGTVVFAPPEYSLATTNSDAFVWACNDPCWNNLLLGDLLERVCDVAIERLPVDLPAPVATPRLPVIGPLTAAMQRAQRATDALIIGSYLSRSTAVALNVRLGQLPIARRSQPAPRIPADASARASLRQRLLTRTDQREGFETYAREMIAQLLPTCFLEGFGELQQAADAIEWPSRPRFVFTSSNFDTDEVFKLWTARQVAAGRRYVIGQHGNNYGTARYCPSEVECIATSDAFITWGWSDGAKCLPAFNFKTANRRQRHDPAGRLLLLELPLPHRLLPWDPYPEFQTYQEEQFSFVAALPREVRRELTVRLHGEHRLQPWREEQRWQRREPDIVVDPGSVPLDGLIRGSRLIVHSYDSTGILETLSLNLPTACFWSGELQHLRDSAMPAYRQLHAAGILHFSPLTLAAHVANIWDDVQGWWGSVPVQAARESFCACYSRTSASPSRDLAALLRGPAGGT